MTEYPFIPARWSYKGRQGRRPIWTVVHATQGAERAGSARNVARYFQTTDRQASTQLVGDSREIIRCVRDADTAFGAKGANNLGLHFEFCALSQQTAIQWDDADSRAGIILAAPAFATWHHEFDIPIRFCDAAALRRFEPGVTTHAEISKAFPGTGHWDPGPNFPMARFLDLVRAAYHGPLNPPEVHPVTGSPRKGICQTRDGRTVVVCADGNVWVGTDAQTPGSWTTPFSVTGDVAHSGSPAVAVCPAGDGVIIALGNGQLIARYADDPGDVMADVAHSRTQVVGLCPASAGAGVLVLLADGHVIARYAADPGDAI